MGPSDFDPIEIPCYKRETAFKIFGGTMICNNQK